jgi:hypothetical protein
MFSFNCSAMLNVNREMLDTGEISDAVDAIRVYFCGYPTRCRARGCHRSAVALARSIDKIGRPLRQYELCSSHASYVMERERAKGRDVKDLRTSFTDLDLR